MTAFCVTCWRSLETKTKVRAVARAVTEFVRRKKAREFGRMIREGVFDYPDPAGHDSANPIPPLYPD